MFCFNYHFFQRKLQSKALLQKIKTERLLLKVKVNNNAETLAQKQFSDIFNEVLEIICF